MEIVGFTLYVGWSCIRTERSCRQREAGHGIVSTMPHTGAPHYAQLNCSSGSSSVHSNVNKKQKMYTEEKAKQQALIRTGCGQECLAHKSQQRPIVAESSTALDLACKMNSKLEQSVGGGQAWKNRWLFGVCLQWFS